MVGRRGRRIVPMVGGDHQHVFRPKGLQDRGEMPVELLERAPVTLRVVAVTEGLVEVHEVREDQPLVDNLHLVHECLDPLEVRAGGPGRTDRATREDVGYLAHTPYLQPRLYEVVQDVM